MNNIKKPMYVPFAMIVLAVALVGCSSTSTPAVTPQPTAAASESIQATVTPTSALATPTASPAPEPSPTVVSTSTPEPTPDASSREFAAFASRLADEAIDFLTTFTEVHSPRASGTQQERDAADFLAAQYEALGYDVSFQPFKVRIQPPDIPMMRLLSPEVRDIDGVPMQFSGLGVASGLLVDVGKAFEDDIPPEGIEGKIALIQRGEISFEAKVSRVEQAGALAAVVYNNVSGLIRGTLTTQADIPAIIISRQDGEAILELMASGDVEASVSFVMEDRDSQNVVAEKQGTGGDNRVVILGGHYDTVPDVPGANDNGSGTATIITIAREVAGKSYPFTVRFIAFGSEELGLLGSSFYVDSLSSEEKESIIAMLNLDALGTGDEVGVLGDSDLTAEVIIYGRDHGVDVRRSFGLTGGSSDHAPFDDADIPIIFFLADDFSRIHSPDDNLDFIQPELMGNSAALAIALLDALAEQP
ncbi:MAG: M28 family peptidase [Chloroflexi bacterium]|nr:M28 family peptidase [Chloroflexota bacterium]